MTPRPLNHLVARTLTVIIAATAIVVAVVGTAGAGPALKKVRLVTHTGVVQEKSVGEVLAKCPQGYRVLTGGFTVTLLKQGGRTTVVEAAPSHGDNGYATVIATQPANPVLHASASNAIVRSTAVCAPIGQAAVMSATNG